jgi:hypothetical protein
MVVTMSGRLDGVVVSVLAQRLRVQNPAKAMDF